VLEAAKKLGEGTTQDFAGESGVELKTVKNKVTELVDDGYLIDTGRTKDRYRIYAVSPGPNPNKGSGPKDDGRQLRVVDDTQERNTVVSVPNPTKGTYTFVDNAKALQRVVEEISPTTAPIALDTETSSLQVREAKVRLLQLRMPDGKPALVDCQTVDLHPLLDALRTKHLLLHNAAYDLAVLYSYFGYEHVGPVSDTMLMFQVFYGGTSKRANLKEVLKTILGMEVSKTEQAANWFGELTPEMLEYAATDVLHLHDLYEALKLRIEDKAPGLQPVVDLENRMAKVTTHMSAVGMPVDEVVFAECVKASREEADKKLSELDALVAVDLTDELAARNAKNKDIPETRKGKVNWDSPEQVRWAFKTVAKLDLENTSKDTLPNVDHPMAVALLEYRKALDVYKRFRDTLVTNGRVYAKWNQLKAKTGRMSCEKPPLQGIPKPLRRAFVAPKGYKLVVSDLSQIEIRVLTVLCGDENLKMDLEAGRDIHRTAAASIFGKDYDDVTADERKLAKGLVFGSMYGLGLAGFTARVNAWTGKKHTPKQVDKKFRQPLFAAYPKVQEWMDRTLSDYERGKTVTYTKLGRRRMQVSSGPEALNTPVQAGALDVMKAIAATVYERRHELKCDVEIVGLVHDEILLVVPEEKASRVHDWLDGIMRSVGEEATNLGVPKEARVPVEASTAICDSWAEKD
jgi:DNA polymerase I-like protein with 3'-5' exonuclease and polymerase domains